MCGNRMFEVHGKKFEIERNDLYALEIENGKHLRLWFSTADQEIWVDQYDVRMLVDVTELHTFNDSLENNLTDDEELDPERYKDLEDSSRTFPPQIEDVSYQIPPSLPIPLGIEVPKTQKQFNIIAHTTKSIRATPQLEIVLKLKQSTTPTFSFLYPENDLYPFYQFLKNLNDSLFWEMYLGRSFHHSTGLSMLEAYEDADTQLNVTRHLRMEPSISDAIDLQLSKFSNPSDFVDGAPPVSLENGDSDRFLFDCEREKFWMKMDPARKISENKLDQDEEPNSAQKMKQKERLRKAKLMSGYYFLQMKDLYKKVSQDNSSEISLSSFGSQKTMRFDDKPIIEKIRTKLKRPRESHLEGSTISKKIHDTIIDSTRNIDPNRLQRKIDKLLQQQLSFKKEE